MTRPITRRHFLRRSAQLAVGAGAGLSLLPSAAGRVPTDGTTERAWRELGQRLSGPLLRPGDPGYAAFAPPDNLRFAGVLPGGIARCAGAADVAESILWCRQFGVPPVARCGGHSYAGYSTTRGLLIDLSPINGIALDPSTRVVTVGGGVSNGNLYTALRPPGVTITHGRCPGVGVGGFFLGGGIGFNMRALGLACDQLVATELVTADGRVLTLDAGRNPDLFWACRGGAGRNFGINTSFSVQTFPVPDLTVFSIGWSTRPEELFAALLAACEAGPPGLGTRVQITPVTPEQLATGHDATVQVLGQLRGTPAQLADILAPVYQVAQPSSATIRAMDYWDAQINFLAEPPAPGFYQERSRFFAHSLGPAAIATAFHWARRWPGTSAGAHVALFQTGDAVNALAPDATAFVHRDSIWLMTISLEWNDAADSPDVIARNRDWQDAFYEAMLPYAGPGSYQNFPDPSLTDFLQSYYGGNLPRLQLVKTQVDPGSLFSYPQGIPPA